MDSITNRNCIKDNERRAGASPNEGELIRLRKEEQAIAQLLLICGSFFLGYIPFCGEKIKHAYG